MQQTAPSPHHGTCSPELGAGTLHLTLLPPSIWKGSLEKEGEGRLPGCWKNSVEQRSHSTSGRTGFPSARPFKPLTRGQVEAASDCLAVPKGKSALFFSHAGHAVLSQRGDVMGPPVYKDFGRARLDRIQLLPLTSCERSWITNIPSPRGKWGEGAQTPLTLTVGSDALTVWDREAVCAASLAFGVTAVSVPTPRGSESEGQNLGGDGLRPPGPVPTQGAWTSHQYSRV